MVNPLKHSIFFLSSRVNEKASCGNARMKACGIRVRYRAHHTPGWVIVTTKRKAGTALA
jgi:hypothetical protein